ncbi:MAG: peptide chain release factor N(5)-glutamine methyltransferase, partial [Synergistaceae bacterium]|nr:peptide chain release factor N(5)-glutamine methyltransferase [Synergistaceae bacterium]
MADSTTASSLRAEASEILSSAGVHLPALEADRIVCHALQIGRASLHAHPERAASPGEASLIRELSHRRARGEPLAYIMRSSIFLDREFEVDRSTLIPRPETEILTMNADRYMKKTRGPGTFADWCTGSGCIAITLASENPLWTAAAVDSSGEALAVALRNARRHDVQDRITFIECADPSEAAKIIR